MTRLRPGRSLGGYDGSVDAYGGLIDKNHPAWKQAGGAYGDVIEYLPDDAGLPDVTERATWRDNPAEWATQRMSFELWVKQHEVLDAVRTERRTAVHSCHSIGKTLTAALVTAWWIDTHPQGSAFVVTTAPTGAQVKAQLWREINRLHQTGLLLDPPIPGRTNLTEWYVGNELVAFGRKPSEYNIAAFHGTHARYILVILDEAAGIPPALWVAAESIASSKHGKILALGNPDVNDGDFAQVCKPDSGWHVIQVGYQDVEVARGLDPETGERIGESKISEELSELLIDREWVEERKRRWGAQSALFYSKCLGRFPLAGSDPYVVVPLNMATRCRYLELPGEADDVREAGVDVGAGGDRTVAVERVGKRVGRWEAFQDPDPVATVGHLSLKLREWNTERVKVDVIGIGWNVYGRLRELSSKHNPLGECAHDAEVVAVDFRHRSAKPRRYLNLRAEVWWEVGRERSRLGTWDLGALAGDDGDDVIAELTNPRYEILDSTGKIKIESKENVRDRVGRSPDVADALLLAFYDGASPQHADTSSVRTMANANIMGGAGDGRFNPFGHRSFAGAGRGGPFGR